MPESSLGVQLLIAEIERFCAQPSPVAGDELAAGLREVARGRNLLDLKFSEMAAAFAQTDQYDVDGCVSPIHWMRLNCHMTSGAAADRIAVGERIDSVPQSVEAMVGGEVGFPHLALIAREAEAVAELGGGRQFDETPLLAKARDLTVGRFRNFCHHHRHAIDPEGYVANQAQACEARALTLKTGEGGMLWIRGVLDPEGGAVVRTALEPLAKRNGRNDDRTAAWPMGWLSWLTTRWRVVRCRARVDTALTSRSPRRSKPCCSAAGLRRASSSSHCPSHGPRFSDWRVIAASRGFSSTLTLR